MMARKRDCCRHCLHCWHLLNWLRCPSPSPSPFPFPPFHPQFRFRLLCDQPFAALLLVVLMVTAAELRRAGGSSKGNCKSLVKRKRKDKKGKVSESISITRTTTHTAYVGNWPTFLTRQGSGGRGMNTVECVRIQRDVFAVHFRFRFRKKWI